MDHGALLAREGDGATVCSLVQVAVIPVCDLLVAPFVLAPFALSVLFLAMAFLPVLWKSPGAQGPKRQSIRRLAIGIHAAGRALSDVLGCPPPGVLDQPVEGSARDGHGDAAGLRGRGALPAWDGGLGVGIRVQTGVEVEVCVEGVFCAAEWSCDRGWQTEPRLVWLHGLKMLGGRPRRRVEFDLGRLGSAVYRAFREGAVLDLGMRMTLGATQVLWSRHAVWGAFFSFDVDVNGGFGVRRFVLPWMDAVGQVSEGVGEWNEMSAEAVLPLPGLWCFEIPLGCGEYLDGVCPSWGFGRSLPVKAMASPVPQ